MKFTIGLDIGTTHTKAVIADESGKATWSAMEGYPFTQPQEGYHEQDPAQILAAVTKVLTKARGEVRDEDITGVCFSSAMHSLIAVDARGTAISPMLTWADTRSNAIATALKNSPRGTAMRLATGTPVHPMSPLCKIAWIREQEPALFRKAARFISIKEFIWFHFTGEYCVDYSIASATGMFDINRLEWFEDALAFAGISADRLSRPVPVHHRSVYESIVFIIGASDGAMANIGTGAVHPGDVALTIGTSGAVRILAKKPLHDPHGRLFNYVVDKDYFLCGGAINNGGITLQWFIDQFYADRKKEGTGEIVKEAEGVPAGAAGLLFLPYVYGERAPVWDAAASGVFMGVRSHHTRAHFLRATLEGICFSLRQIIDALEENGQHIETVFASGGFTNSPLWLSILCNILDKKIVLTQDADASAMGAIFLGMNAAGLLPTWRHPAPATSHEEALRPDPSTHGVYASNYAVFGQLYNKLKDDFPSL